MGPVFAKQYVRSGIQMSFIPNTHTHMATALETYSVYLDNMDIYCIS